MKKAGLRRALTIILITAVMVLAMSFTAFANAGGFGANAAGFYANEGWTDWAADNKEISRDENYFTSLKFILQGQPEGMNGGIQYKANIQGRGWCSPVENGAELGDPASVTPIESISICLTGALGENYDILYRVRQAGAWTDWVCNGQNAGQECKGLIITGVQVQTRFKAGSSAAVNSARPMIALTFDDGPSSENTPRVLSYLESVGGKATFFMVGNRVAPNAGLLQRMVADGCEVGNHTWGHETLTKLSNEQIINTLNAANDAIQAACGVRPIVMRPPGGAYNDNVLANVGNLGMSAYYWSVDTRDWKTRNAQATIDHVLANAKDGDIILMHDIHSATADACAVLIPELVNRGFQLVTVSELASYRGGGVPGNIYFSLR